MEEYTIGQRIAARRKELGLSQIDLGEKMGVSRQSVSKWESDAAIPAENLGGYSRVELVMECRLMDGLDLISPVAVLQLTQISSRNG